jgi:hypothetical protein
MILELLRAEIGKNRLKLWTRITSNAGGLVVAASIMRWNSGRRPSVADAPGST